MAKALVIANCQGNDRQLKAGTILEWNERSATERDEARQLFTAGRIVDDTPENRARYQTEVTGRAPQAGQPANVRK